MSKTKYIFVTIAACLIILLIAGGIVWWIQNSEPTAQRETATKRTPMLVETVKVQVGDYSPQLQGLGRVAAAEEVMLRPRVGGEVIEISKNLEPGAMVKKGEVLARLDPADYQNALAMRQSELHQAEADLAMEEGQQAVARKEYDLLQEELNPQQRALVLREPQMQTAKARVESALAAVEQAQLDLDRTTLRAPFDAQVLERMINVGSQIDQGDAVAHLVGTQEYWVEATVPLTQLQWIELGSNPSEAVIRKRGVWTDGQQRVGTVVRVIGTLDEQTRLARVLISVNNPIGNEEAVLLILDSIVEVTIAGREMEGVVRLDRDYLRENDTVWVMQDSKLSIRKVDVLFRDAEYAYIASGLEQGDAVVRTNLSRVREGAELRTEGAAE